MIADLNGEKLADLVALVFSAVLVAALEAQAIGAPEFPQLALSAEVIRATLGTIVEWWNWSRRDRGHWWSR